MTLEATDDYTTAHYDEDHRYWLCINEALAYQTALEHPGDTIMLYERDRDGRMVNKQVWWKSTMYDDNKLNPIRGGRIRQ